MEKNLFDDIFDIFIKLAPSCFGLVTVCPVCSHLFVSDLAMLSTRSSEEESVENEEMDTTEPNWCWFYLAECGVWHMFEVVRRT